MAAETTVTKNLETTDFLARQEGAFEQCSVQSVTPIEEVVAERTNPDFDELTVPSSFFNARHILVQIETFDKNRHTIAFNPHFTAYDNRLSTLRAVKKEGVVWYAHRDNLTDGIRDWNVVLAPTQEKAAKLNSEGVPFGSLNFGNMFRVFSRMVITVGGLFGEVNVRDRPSGVLTAYSRPKFTGKLPSGSTDLDKFCSVAPTERETAEVVGVPDLNTLNLFKDGYEFPLKFSGRVTEKGHTPTDLARELGVRTPENLINEEILIAPCVNESLLSFSPVGSNKSKTFCVGTTQ